MSTIDKAERSRSGQATLTSSAYKRLREAILSTELAPGSRITIRSLQQSFDIGPTPLREALARLAADNFVVGEDNRGFRVPPVTLVALRDITDQRKLIECAGLRQSIERGDDAFEQRLVATYHSLSRLDERRSKGEPNALAQWEVQHRNFHSALIGGAKSEWLERFQDILFDQADRYRRLYNRSNKLRPEIVDDHKRILEATLARDADMAVLLLDRHIERVYIMAAASGTLSEK